MYLRSFDSVSEFVWIIDDFFVKHAVASPCLAWSLFASRAHLLILSLIDGICDDVIHVVLVVMSAEEYETVDALIFCCFNSFATVRNWLFAAWARLICGTAGTRSA
jgi:hypothetical protein